MCEQLEVGFDVERQVAGENPEHHDAEPVDVGPRVGRVGHDLLGGHVFDVPSTRSWLLMRPDLAPLAIPKSIA